MSKIYYIGATGINEIGSVYDAFNPLNFIEAPLVFIENALKMPFKSDAVAKVKNDTKAATVQPVADDSLLEYVWAQAQQVLDLMQARGISYPALGFCVYESYFETAAYHDYKWTDHNNGSGIMFANQKGASKGTDGYAWFDSRSSWADAFHHEITKGSNPAGAQTLEDYATRLQKDGYFTASYDLYLSGLKRARLVLKSIPAEGRAGIQPDGSDGTPIDNDIPGSTIKYDQQGNVIKPKKKLEDKWDDLSDLEKGGLILAGLGTLKIILGK